MRTSRHQNRELPLGLSYGGTPANALIHQNAGSITSAFPRMTSSARRPRLHSAAAEMTAPRPAASQRRQIERPARAFTTLNQAVGYHNPRILDIANNFALNSGREAVSKVYAAAAALGVQYRPIARMPSSTWAFSSVAMRPSVSPSRSWSADITSTPEKAPARSVSFRPRIGQSYGLSRYFASPLSGTGMFARTSSPVMRSAGWSFAPH